jgi:hypothetical protein
VKAIKEILVIQKIRKLKQKEKNGSKIAITQSGGKLETMKAANLSIGEKKGDN